MKPRFLASVDTEEDIWGWSPNTPITAANVAELPHLLRFFQRLRIRPTFFVSYQVLHDPSARAVLRELAREDGVDIGCHVHPWNTPPFDHSGRDTMLCHYAPEVQAAKILTVTRLIEDLLGRRPTSFRAGRFGFGAATAACLVEQGYSVDSSVTPYFDWRSYDDGPNYVGAPLHTYRINPEVGVTTHDPRGKLIEVPLTSGYSRMSAYSWKTLSGVLDRPVAKATHLGGACARLLGLRRVILSPEPHSVSDMLALSTRALAAGVDHLHLFFHSSSLIPGLTPFTPTRHHVQELYGRVEQLLVRLEERFEMDFVNVSEAAQSSS